MGSMCEILAQSLSHSYMSLSLYSFELVYNTVQNNANGVQRAAVPSSVPISAIFGCKQSATRLVPVLFPGSKLIAAFQPENTTSLP